MILVTGASGHLGQTVIAQLQKQFPSTAIAALVRSEEKGAALKAQGIQLRLADYHDTAALQTALQGVEKVVLISSSDFNGRLQQHKNVVDAAVLNGVKHIYYTGVAMNDINTSPLKPFLEDHFQTEAYIKECGLTYTFLQHSLYAEVVPLFIGEQALQTGVFFPAGEGEVAFATRADLAEAIALIVSSQGHDNKIYQMTNTETYSFATVAQYLSEINQSEVAYVSPEPEVFAETLRTYNVPEPIIGMSLGFAAGIKNNDFNQPSNQLAKILGRTPTSLKSFLAQVYQK
jgi:NAD(P)H dehydrogenase (quinone)